MSIAVDIGNGHLSFSVSIDERLRCVSVGWSAETSRFLAPDRSTELDLWRHLRDSTLDTCFIDTSLDPASESNPQIPTSLSWWISSVNPPATEKLRAMLHEHRPHDVIQVIDQTLIPLADDLLHRDRTGVDRLLAAWFSAQYLTRFPDREAGDFPGVIVVDAGSAVTVDWVDRQGVFRGGMIYPGFRLAAQSLHRGTAALPLVQELSGGQVPAAVGRATIAALEAGLFWSQWGGLRGSVETLQKHALAEARAASPEAEPSLRPNVVVTGGGISPFQSLLPADWQWEPQLMPRAILQLAEVVSKRRS